MTVAAVAAGASRPIGAAPAAQASADAADAELETIKRIAREEGLAVDACGRPSPEIEDKIRRSLRQCEDHDK
eukprot:12644623-Heterocapsa_arctica.AAC.1